MKKSTGIRINRTNSENGDFRELVKKLDAELAIRDGNEHAFYHQFNSIEGLDFVVVIYDGQHPVACGAMKEFDTRSLEVKRMYTLENHRGRGYATRVLDALENWAQELRYTRCVLETGKRQPEAIRLYQRQGYLTIPNFGPYIGVSNSLCFAKVFDSPVE
jgi:GNAT superfamily N-acetyltransferase